MMKESPEFIAECAAFAEMELQAETIRLTEVMSKHKASAESVTIHILARLLLNG